MPSDGTDSPAAIWGSLVLFCLHITLAKMAELLESGGWFKQEVTKQEGTRPGSFSRDMTTLLRTSLPTYPLPVGPQEAKGTSAHCSWHLSEAHLGQSLPPWDPPCPPLAKEVCFRENPGCLRR